MDVASHVLPRVVIVSLILFMRMAFNDTATGVLFGLAWPSNGMICLAFSSCRLALFIHPLNGQPAIQLRGFVM